MTPSDFRRIALSFEGVEESSHMGSPDFRVGGHIFATLAHQSKGYGNLMLSGEQQAAFVEDDPKLFIPVAGGWGRSGATHIVLARASEDSLQGALGAAFSLRLSKNKKSPTAKRPSKKRSR